MPSEYGAIAADFYINQRLNLKMDLPMRRDTVLALFDRIRRTLPGMDRFKRYEAELALESKPAGGASGAGPGGGQQWLAIRKTSVRSGSVNPESSEQAYGLHKLALEAAPYFLDISPLDVDHLEVLFGFDMPAAGNHDAIVFNALYAGSPLAALAEAAAGSEAGAVSPRYGAAAGVPIDCQPVLGIALSDSLEQQAHIEIKTRTTVRQVKSGEYREDPISIYLIVREYGPFNDTKDLLSVHERLTERGERLLNTCIVPKLLVPIRHAISAGT
jgi:hypothetical protein